MIDIESYFDFLKGNSLSSEQFLFCCFLYLKKPGIEMLKYYHHHIRKIPKSDLDDLERRGLITNFNSDGDAYPEFYALVDEVWDRALASDPKALWREFYNSYPNTVYIKGTKVPLKTGDLDELPPIYMRRIKHSKKIHAKVVEKTLWYKKQVEEGRIGAVGIDKYVKSALWNTLEEITEDAHGIEIY